MDLSLIFVPLAMLVLQGRAALWRAVFCRPTARMEPLGFVVVALLVTQRQILSVSTGPMSG